MEGEVDYITLQAVPNNFNARSSLSTDHWKIINSASRTGIDPFETGMEGKLPVTS
jgi:hypothetical protein